MPSPKQCGHWWSLSKRITSDKGLYIYFFDSNIWKFENVVHNSHLFHFVLDRRDLPFRVFKLPKMTISSYFLDNRSAADRCSSPFNEKVWNNYTLSMPTPPLIVIPAPVSLVLLVRVRKYHSKNLPTDISSNNKTNSESGGWWCPFPPTNFISPICGPHLGS